MYVVLCFVIGHMSICNIYIYIYIYYAYTFVLVHGSVPRTAAPVNLHVSIVSCSWTTPSDTLFSRISRPGEAVGTNRLANCRALTPGCGHNSWSPSLVLHRVCPNDLVQRQSYIYTFVCTRGCDPYVHVQHVQRFIVCTYTLLLRGTKQTLQMINYVYTAHNMYSMWVPSN